MADNVSITAGAGVSIAADDVSSVMYQRVKLDGGGDGVSAPVLGDSTYGLDVDVTRLPALPAGTNNIGDVDVLTLPALPAGSNNIGDVDIASAPTGSSAIQVQGTIAADAAVANNPVLMGARGAAAFPTAMSASGDMTIPMSDLYGRLVTQAGAPPELVSAGVSGAITDTTITDILGAAGTGLKWYITAVMVTNSHASVGTLVTIQDDTGTPVKYWGGYAASSGGGFAITFNPAIGGGQANGKIRAVCGTTGANVYVSVAAYKGI